MTLTEEQRLALLAPYDRDKYPLYRSALIAMNGKDCNCDKLGTYKNAVRTMNKLNLNIEPMNKNPKKDATGKFVKNPVLEKYKNGPLPEPVATETNISINNPSTIATVGEKEFILKVRNDLYHGVFELEEVKAAYKLIICADDIASVITMRRTILAYD